MMKKVTNKLGILLTIIATCAFMTACGGEEPAGGGGGGGDNSTSE